MYYQDSKTYTYAEAKQLCLKYFKGDEMATDAYLSKYALKKDGDKDKIYEPTPDYMHHRMASEFARVEQKYPNPLTEKEIFELFDHFKYIIPQGGSMANIGNPLPVSLANCFVVGNRSDSYGAICKTDEEQVQICKRRGGVGHDLSHLRPAGMLVHNAANTTSGLATFMERYSNSIKEVAQHGRRGALMLSCSVKSLDTEKFIDAKLDLHKVTGANISIKLDDEFMKAVKEHTSYTQQFPIEGKPQVSKKIDAAALWKKIMHNAWKSAEPGVIFWDTILKESTGRLYGKEYEEFSLNPCAELPLPIYGSCILLCMNLYSYVKNPFTQDAFFDTNLFIEHAGIAQRLADDIIELEKEKIQQILNKIESDPEPDNIKSTEYNLWSNIKKMHESVRRTGVGITGLGDMLAALGYTYGTKDATEFAAGVQKRLAVSVYAQSVELAKERGCFPIWDLDIEHEAPFVQRILKSFTSEQFQDYIKYGRRNISSLTIAPTGTVSLLSQTTSGIECVFMPFYVRRRKVSENEHYDFKDLNGECFQEYVVVHPKLVEWYIATQEKELTYEDAIKKLSGFSSVQMQELVDKSPYHNATTRDVDWVEKVRMQGMIQKYVDHSISVTVNLPESATEELVSKVYMTAYDSGCKGCTIYREGSRDGVLINKEDSKSKKTNLLSSGHMSKRKPVLPAIVDVIKCHGETFVVLIGIDDDKPYEVFAFKLQKEEIPVFRKIKQTTITKVAKKHYALGKEFDHVWGADNILCREGSEEEQAITRMVSTMLRGGRIPLEEIIDQIIKSSTSIDKFSKALAICLQKFLKDGLVLHEKCPNCGGDMISYEGCKRCVNCGQSKCG